MNILTAALDATAKLITTLGRVGAVFGRIVRRRRIHVVMQMSEVECGAACLTMILNYHGRKTPIAECREKSGVGRDGVTARTIAQTARQYGLQVRAYSIEMPDWKHVPLPAIAHWEFNHFVVVEGWSPKKVRIVDPAMGRRQLTLDEFGAGFTGVVLTFEPSRQFERCRSATKPLWRNYARDILSSAGVRGTLAQILAASALLQVLGLAFPVLTKVLMDSVLPFHAWNLMSLIGMGALVIVIARTLTTYLRSAMFIYLEARLDSQAMLGFFEHVLSLPCRFFQERTSGDLLMRLGSNTTIRQTLTQGILSAILDGGLIVVYMVILLFMDPLLGGLAFGMGMVQVVILVSARHRLHGLIQRGLVAAAESQSYLVEVLTGIVTVKASGAEDRAFDRWSNLFTKHLNISLEQSRLSTIIEALTIALQTLSPLVLLWVGVVRVLNGSMSLGTMLALNALAASFMGPLAALVSSWQQFQLIGAHLDRLADVLQAAPEQDPRTAEVPPRLAGRIELKNVSFRYDPNAPLVIRNLSLTIEPGQKVALVGRSGAGKSTLARILLGLYPPTEGEILYDGRPLQSLEYRALRSQFGVVLQEPFLFSGSIRQNIAFNTPDLSLEQLTESARLAAIHDEILQMPMGYETRIGEGGEGVSGGQRQRISIARAVAHRPAMLVFDEATSHLDAVTEQSIEDNLRHLSCTRVVIAHRLSTIRDADLIVVLDAGVIVERGSHEELLSQDGLYATLVNRQSESSSTKSQQTPP